MSSPSCPAASCAEYRLDVLASRTPYLNALQQRRLGKLLGVEETLSPGQALVWWVANLLQRARLVDQEQTWLLLEELAPNISILGEQLEAALAGDCKAASVGKLPVITLGIADRAFAVITGKDAVLELKTGKWIEGARSQFLERVLYDLTTLYCRERQALPSEAGSL